MKKYFCLLVYLICGISLWPANCFGRLGETEEQLAQRYGQPYFQSTKKDDVPPGGEKTMIYVKDKIVIHVTLLRGRSASEGFRFNDANGRPIPIEGDVMEKAEAILDANSNGRKWQRHPAPQMVNKEILHGWERDDDAATAMVWRSNPNVLEVSTNEFHQESRRASRAAAAGASGF